MGTSCVATNLTPMKQAIKRTKPLAAPLNPPLLMASCDAVNNALPIAAYRDSIITALTTHDTLVLSSETGSGKSTQVPQYILHSALGELKKKKKNPNSSPLKIQQKLITCTQPRRVAAISVATRVASEMSSSLGQTVGYCVRFDSTQSPATRILYQTDGMLLREVTASDGDLLPRYSVIILDEAHERSLRTDILFGITKKAMLARNYSRHDKSDVDIDPTDTALVALRARCRKLKLPPLKCVVMSATIAVSDFLPFFPNATSLSIPGRTFPVQVLYTAEPVEDFIDGCLEAVLQLHTGYRESVGWGDILVFLPGQDEIEDMQALLRTALKNLEADRSEKTSVYDKMTTSGQDKVTSLKGMGANTLTALTPLDAAQVVPLYSALPPEQQMVAFADNIPGASRKIILSTNLAETSVTLANVAFVVDSGRHKTRRFNPATGMEALEVESIAKAQGTQRAGRSGRTRPGICLRMFTEETWEELEEAAAPEILRVNLAQVVLQLKAMKIEDPRKFDYVTPPDTQSLIKAFKQLYALGALDAGMQLTDHGRKMAILPLSPVFANMVLKSKEFGCVSEILTVVAMLSAENVFYRPSGENSGAAQKAAAAHRRFVSHEGDLPTLLSVYKAWTAEAAYLGAGVKHRDKRMKQMVGKEKMSHGDWCSRNYVNGRALGRAFDVRAQLEELCGRSSVKNGLGMDVGSNCGGDLLVFLKCICAGLFMQAARRDGVVKGGGAKKGGADLRGRYKTVFGNFVCNVHPTSCMFQRNPAPQTVVYTELVVTKKSYLRGVTQVKAEWLAEVAPQFKNEMAGGGD